jgi:hypothetical protein
MKLKAPSGVQQPSEPHLTLGAFMRRYVVPVIVFIIGFAGVARFAWALRITQPVTPEYIQQNPKQFSVVAEKQDDGLIHFTIKRFLSRPSFLAATTEIRNGKTILLQNTSTAFVHEDSATFYLAVAPERIADTKFTLFDGTFSESNGKPVATVGGTDYDIQLSDFAKSASEVKTSTP